MAIYQVVAQDFDLIDRSKYPQQTGKITIKQLFKAEAAGALIGHTETATDTETLTKKVNEIIALQKEYPTALPYNVIILGENFEEFSNNSLYEIAQLIKNHCSTIFQSIPDEFIKNALLVYEPRWSVNPTIQGKQHPPSPKLISQVTKKIRNYLTERLGPTGHKVSIMFGEISTPERAVEVLRDENLQGLMLGNACTTTEELLEIIKSLQQAFDNRKIILVCNFKTFDLDESYQDYLDALAIVPDNFKIYFAPPATEIKNLVELIKK